MNRVYSEQFPNTVKEVVFEKNQFSPIFDGAYYRVEVTDFVKDAVDEAYRDYSETNNAMGALYFSAGYISSNKEPLFTDKNGQNFYR